MWIFCAQRIAFIYFISVVFVRFSRNISVEFSWSVVTWLWEAKREKMSALRNFTFLTLLNIFILFQGLLSTPVNVPLSSISNLLVESALTSLNEYSPYHRVYKNAELISAQKIVSVFRHNYIFFFIYLTHSLYITFKTNMEKFTISVNFYIFVYCFFKGKIEK